MSPTWTVGEEKPSNHGPENPAKAQNVGKTFMEHEQERLVEAVLEGIMLSGATENTVIADLADSWPDLPAPEAIRACLIACENILSTFTGGEERKDVDLARRTALEMATRMSSAVDKGINPVLLSDLTQGD